MKRLFYFLLVFTAIFVLSYNVWYFTLRQAKAPAWQEVQRPAGGIKRHITRFKAGHVLVRS